MVRSSKPPQILEYGQVRSYHSPPNILLLLSTFDTLPLISGAREFDSSEQKSEGSTSVGIRTHDSASGGDNTYAPLRPQGRDDSCLHMYITWVYIYTP